MNTDESLMIFYYEHFQQTALQTAQSQTRHAVRCKQTSLSCRPSGCDSTLNTDRGRPRASAPSTCVCVCVSGLLQSQRACDPLSVPQLPHHGFYPFEHLLPRRAHHIGDRCLPVVPSLPAAFPNLPPTIMRVCSCARARALAPLRPIHAHGALSRSLAAAPRLGSLRLRRCRCGCRVTKVSGRRRRPPPTQARARGRPTSR